MRVITFSRYFPKGHPRAGEPTYFVEKMIRAYYLRSNAMTISTDLIDDFYLNQVKGIEPVANFEPKWHTIRAGNRWKVGDLYAPRVWSGKPYASKQISFLPPIKIEKIWEFGISKEDYFIKGDNGIIRAIGFDELGEIAKNDGLDRDDFETWFAMHPKKGENAFTGQVLCHNAEINY